MWQRSVLAMIGAVGVLAGMGLAADPAVSPVVIPRAEQFDVTSKAGLGYRIFVAPPGGTAPATGYPVIYLTDANSNFPLLLSAVQRRARGEATAVVVGIGYPSTDQAVHGERRTYDLTSLATADWLKTFPKGPSLGKSGGNDEFLNFIEGELKQLVVKKYPIDRTRQTLFGHSFGGLFVLHALFAKPGSFQTYLASSPSIWWNDRSVLAEEEAFTEKIASKEVKARLMLSVGEWEQKAGPKVPKERADMLLERRMVDNATDMATRLGKLQSRGLEVIFREFPEEDHGSVVLPAASRGVRFALDGSGK